MRINKSVPFKKVDAAVRACGLCLRGGFHPVEDDDVPALPGGAETGTLVLVGNLGAAMWQVFRSSRFAAGGGNPLDEWSRSVVSALAGELGAHPLFPFAGPPYLPFPRWAMRADTVWPSPIGPLIHPDFGLWHAYRGALAFAARIALPARPERANPCDACADRPCLRTCPVAALAPGSYDVPACTGYLDATAGNDCLGQGCRARRACPVGTEFGYEPDQAALHMSAFLRANR